MAEYEYAQRLPDAFRYDREQYELQIKYYSNTYFLLDLNLVNLPREESVMKVKHRVGENVYFQAIVDAHFSSIIQR